MKKRTILMALAFACAFVPAVAQQVTKIAVIDLQKVYLTYNKDSQAVQAFEQEKARVEAEIQRLYEEVRGLEAKRLELRQKGDATALQELEAQLLRKVQFLSDYVKVKKAELDAKAKALAETDSFVQVLYRTIQSVAELDGYSIVLSANNANSVNIGIVWYSPMINITDKVIQALLGTKQ